jgi:Holliday junction resolvasome RuvABC endonuclease subunit
VAKRIKKLRAAGAGPLVGIDQSARGTAAAALVDGKLRGLLLYADTKGAAKKLTAQFAVSGGDLLVTVLEPREAKAGDEAARTARLEHLKYEIRRFVETWNPTHAALEDYALARKAYAHSLGEVGGVVRLELWRMNVPFRVYDVQAVKMFTTGRGDAEKADMILACRDRWEGINFLEYGKTEGAAGNAADAYSIAHLLRAEIRLRAGEISLEDLPEAERRVFLRTTKQRPVNVLDLPFAERADG